MTKSECRKLFTEKRKQFSEVERALESEKILNRLLDTIDLTNKTVSIFLPIKSKKEIDTFPLLDLKNKLAFRIVLPSADFSTNNMTHYLFESYEQIKESNYGIPEPTEGQQIDSSQIDIVIVPLLCFDLKGYRVGYGKGFYDHFLSSCRPDCEFIGLSFFEPIEQIEDVYENDIQIHQCITPNNIYVFSEQN